MIRRVVQINATCGAGSTGKICVSISTLLKNSNVPNYIFYSTGDSPLKNSIKFCTLVQQKMNALIGRVFGNNGFNSSSSTKKLIKELKRINPNIIHLHNLHANDINLELLFDYIKKNHIKVYWTFHDCWAFTGYCTYFDYVKCDKWKKKCFNCPQREKSSWFFDNSTELYYRKKKCFDGVDITVITPSQWLANLVKESFLSNKEVKVINNGIDLTVFFPRKTQWRKKIKAKYMVLGVAFGWGKRKGLESFIYFAKTLSDDYQIVLVGTDDTIDRMLPNNIISIHRTNNQDELAEIYSSADVFVNPTLEENYPTVNMEAIACGTPVISFDTGGSAEIFDDSCGLAIKKGDNQAMLNAIVEVCEKQPFSEDMCIKRAASFDMWDRFSEYIKMYNEYQKG